VVEDVELLLIDPEGEEDTTIHEFKNMKIGDIEHVQFKESFRCYCSSVEAVRFQINGGVEKKIAGKGAGNFRWKDN
jgi:oligoribonuclease NrnB/cAMP/cGMP phosphodiesterase (DHH superfamily)